MPATSYPYPEDLDITNCEKEPIHIIGKVQSHGVLIACDLQTRRIWQGSENTSSRFGKPLKDLQGKALAEIIGKEKEELLRAQIEADKPLLPQELFIGGENFLMLPHIEDNHLILDFEPLERSQDSWSFQQQLTRVLNSLRAGKNVAELCREAAHLTSELLGYDRVMIYKFDEDWNGEVVAEEKLPQAESWLGLHYPASDIPSQSRNLFLKHRVRIISNVKDVPVSLVPQISPVTKKPLDLSRSTLRGVSPIHLEYLENMGVGASLTAAIIVEGKLWGLIACHHNTSKFLNYYERESCRFLAQMLSNEIALRETSDFLQQTEISGRVREKLVQQMEEQSPISTALVDSESEFTDLISCGGGALYLDNHLSLTGETPTEEQVKQLLESFLSFQQESLFSSSQLSREFSPAEDYKEKASGILSLRISENNYIIWFRPEVIQTVNWGGNPQKKMTYNDEKQRLSPRKSFEKWTQQLTGISRPWKDFDRSVAKALRENVSYFMLVRQRNEINELNRRLLSVNKELELFSYGLSHDLRAPLRGISGYLQIVQEDYNKALGEEGSLLLNNALGLTERMDALIEDILSYSRLNDGDLEVQQFSANDLVDDVLKFLNVKAAYPSTHLEVQEGMPPMSGDRRMMFQVWTNLINNAFLYSSGQVKPKVEIGCIDREEKNVYFVRDNGIGIAPEHKEKIFATFSRLAGADFKGSGIGLALVKRVLEKHEGKVWVDSEPGRGSTFYFSV